MDYFFSFSNRLYTVHVHLRGEKQNKVHFVGASFEELTGLTSCHY